MFVVLDTNISQCTPASSFGHQKFGGNPKCCIAKEELVETLTINQDTI